MSSFCSWQLNGESFTRQHADLVAYHQPDVLCLQGVNERYMTQMQKAIDFKYSSYCHIGDDLGTAILSHYAMGDVSVSRPSRLITPQLKYVALASGMVTVCNLWIRNYADQDFSILDNICGPTVIMMDGLPVEFEMEAFRYKTAEGELSHTLLSEQCLNGLGDVYARFIAMRPKLRYMLHHVWPEGPLALSSVSSAQQGAPISSFILCNNSFRVINAGYEFIESCAVGACTSLIIAQLSVEMPQLNLLDHSVISRPSGNLLTC